MTLLLALTLGMCLGSTAMSTRVCVLTLDTCCDSSPVALGTCDCCDTHPERCCLVVQSDEAAVLAPERILHLDLASLNLEFSEALSLRPLIICDQVFDTPDPPPLSLQERLARFEIRLI